MTISSHKSRALLACFFVTAGVVHFLLPAPFLTIMPPWVPFPEAANALAGAAEVAGGIGVLIPRTRRAAGWGLIALLIAVFPANIQAALHGWPTFPGIPRWFLVARLPLQAVFIAWVYLAAVRRGSA